MPLFVTYINPDTNKRELSEWRVNDPVKPVTTLKDKIVLDIVIHAVGPELKYIYDRFDNIPILKNLDGGWVTWEGDIAKFIYNNL